MLRIDSLSVSVLLYTHVAMLLFLFLTGLLFVSLAFGIWVFWCTRGIIMNEANVPIAVVADLDFPEAVHKLQAKYMII